MKKYKALMLDLDGTTVPNRLGSMPSNKTKNAINKARKFIHVGVVTARPPVWAKPVIKELDLSAPCILSGGAIIFDPVHDKILWKKNIPKKVALGVVEILKKNNTPFLYPRDSFVMEPTFQIDIADGGQVEIAVPEIKNEKADAILKELEKFKNISVHKVTGWENDKVWLQITHAESTKQHGILKAADILKIKTDDIIGVGDSYNDFPLLMACGLKVAMGNAVPELKEIADVVAPSIEEDGVAWVIEKFILNQK